jgi:mono/diheme cytochrome c family protein
MIRYCSREDRMATLFALILLLLPQQSLSQQFQYQQLRSQQLFGENCAGCHGDEGRGSAKGPALAMNQRVAEQSTGQLGAYLERGNIAAGMPSFSDLSADDRTALVG